MARVHGKDANYSINAVAIENDMRQARLLVRVSEGEITAFADAYGNFLQGKKGVTVELSGVVDPASGEQDATLFGLIGGGPVTTILDPTGSGPGANAPTYNCTASGLTGSLVRRYSIDVPVGGPAAWEATIQNSGSTTRAVA